jgi:hypothetical protein
MERTIMMFQMPRYEVRYHDKEEWQAISEVEVLESLQEMFFWVTPALKDMIEGKRVMTPDATYRIKGMKKKHHSSA